MKCQHCASNDIIQIQGQNYCLNCGYAVDAKAEVKAPAVKKSQPKAVKAEVAQKVAVGVGAESAAPVAITQTAEEPQPVVVAKPDPVPKPVVAPKIFKPKTAPVAIVTPYETAAVATAVKVAPEPRKRAPRVLNPAKGSVPKSKARPKAKPQSVSIVVKKELQVAEIKERPVAAARSLDIQHKDAPKTGSKHVHPMRFALKVSGILSLVIGTVVASALWLRLDTDITVYLGIASLTLLMITITLAQSALLYGRSRGHDGRPVAHAQWWAAARSGFMDVVNVNVFSLICFILVFATGFVLWQAGLRYLDGNDIVQSVVLALGNIALTWLLLGLYITRRLATPAVVIGGLTFSSGMKVGWRMYRRAGGHLIATAIEGFMGRIIGLVALLGAVYAAALYMPGQLSHEIVSAGVGALAALVVFLVTMVLLDLDTKLWVSQYRHWAVGLPPAERLRLLTGRVQPRKP